MIATGSLRQKLLDLAVSGKLVPRTGAWRTVRFGEICQDFNVGIVIKPTRYYTDDPTVSIKAFRNANIRPNQIDDSNWVLVTLKATEENPRCVVHGGDVVIARSGVPGIAAVVPDEFDGYAAIDILIATPRREIVESVYLAYALNSPMIQRTIASLNRGVALSHIGVRTVSDLSIPLPPLEEQKRIVARLEELLALEREIAADGAALDDLVAAARRKILDLAVSGKLVPQLPEYGCSTAILEEAYCLKKKSVNADVVNPIPQPYKIPASWTWCRTGSLGTMIRGNGIKRSETIPEGCPCIRYGEIYTSYDTSFVTTESFVPQELYDRCKKIVNGDLVYTLTGENKPDIAKTIAYEGEVPVAAGGDLAIWSGHCCHPRYLSFFMASTTAREQVASLATGDIVCHISADKVGSLWLPLPPLAEQKAIVKRVDELMALLDAMKG